jgi:hypothetical protein
MVTQNGVHIGVPGYLPRAVVFQLGDRRMIAQQFKTLIRSHGVF